jgi:hypothetical protein
LLKLRDSSYQERWRDRPRETLATIPEGKGANSCFPVTGGKMREEVNTLNLFWILSEEVFFCFKID